MKLFLLLNSQACNKHKEWKTNVNVNEKTKLVNYLKNKSVHNWFLKCILLITILLHPKCTKTFLSNLRKIPIKINNTQLFI